MKLLPTNEFLVKKLGFIHGNPFSDTQAEEEEQLPKYFVDLPAFYKILDTDTGKPKSSVLSANRGAGKSANRKNVERWLREGPKPGFVGNWPWVSPICVVSYVDFTHLKSLVKNDFLKTRPEDHIDAILWACISSLLSYLEKNWEKQKEKDIPDQIIFQLGYYLVNYSTTWGHLRNARSKRPSSLPSLNRDLETFLAAACLFAPNANYLESGSTTILMQVFRKIASAFGIRDIVILVDGIDELELTADDPHLSAAILKPLIAERALMQMDGIYFKFFLPSAVVSELQRFPQTRIGERIKFYEVDWDEDSIQFLLSERIKAFSNGTLHDLAQLATPDLSNLGRILASHVHNNPRRLLKLCEWVLIHLEQSTGQGNTTSKRSLRPRITQSVLKSAIESFENDPIQRTTYFVQEEKSQKLIDGALLSVGGWEITQDLRVFHLGKMLSSKKLNRKEYQVLSYLLQHPGQLIMRDEIGQAVWKEEWVSRYSWVLNQTILRIRKKIGAKKIETVRGLGYIFHIEENSH